MLFQCEKAEMIKFFPPFTCLEIIEFKPLKA